MTEAQFEQARRDFVIGRTPRLRLGGYGGTVTVRVVGTAVQIETTKPRRRQRRIGPNSRMIRETAVQAAQATLDRIRAVPPVRTPSVPARKPRPAGLITPRDVWLSYLRLRLGEVPDDVLGWGRKAVAAFMRSLAPEARHAAPEASSISTILQAARRLDRDGAVPLDADLESIQPGTLDRWVMAQLRGGASPHTLKTYRSRFRSAVRSYMASWPQEWGGRIDPTRNVKRISTERVRPQEIGEERAARLMGRMRARGAWRALATTMIADATGRRVASISGEREDLHMDAPPLCAADFRRAEDGVLEVVWRAAAAKGNAYGRGDVVMPATRQLAVVHRWLTQYHPNPLGPEHPLVWDEADPTRAESYDRLTRELEHAWEEEFGERKPTGVGFHSFVRTVVNTLADRLGTLAAAEYTGRSVKMVESTYRRARRGTLQGTARTLDEIRRGRRIKAVDRPAVGGA